MGNSHKNPVAQLEPNFDKIVIGWSSSINLEGNHPRIISAKFG
jgi:hypothetical protein